MTSQAAVMHCPWHTSWTPTLWSSPRKQVQEGYFDQYRVWCIPPPPETPLLASGRKEVFGPGYVQLSVKLTHQSYAELSFRFCLARSKKAVKPQTASSHVQSVTWSHLYRGHKTCKESGFLLCFKLWCDSGLNGITMKKILIIFFFFPLLIFFPCKGTITKFQQ